MKRVSVTTQNNILMGQQLSLALKQFLPHPLAGGGVGADLRHQSLVVSDALQQVGFKGLLVFALLVVRGPFTRSSQ